MIGDPSAGRAQLQWLVERAAAALCAMQVGVADRALRITAAYGAERRQFDRPIGSFQAFHTRAADAYVDLEVLRLVTWQAAYLLSKQETATDAVVDREVLRGRSGAQRHLRGGAPARRHRRRRRLSRAPLLPVVAADRADARLGRGHLAALGDRLAG